MCVSFRLELWIVLFLARALVENILAIYGSTGPAGPACIWPIATANARMRTTFYSRRAISQQHQQSYVLQKYNKRLFSYNILLSRLLF